MRRALALLLLAPQAIRGHSCSAQEGHFCTEAPTALRAAPDFRSLRVALLLVGEPFRSLRSGKGAPRQPCHEESADEQEEASLSYVQKVITPLERRGATVEVLYTFPTCVGRQYQMNQLYLRMRGWFGPRVVAVANVSSRSMDEGWQLGHALLASHMKEQRVTYDYVLHSRHDLYLEVDMFLWPADWTKLLFEMECVLTSAYSCTCGWLGTYASKSLGRCHANHLMWIPQKHLKMVQNAIFEASAGAGVFIGGIHVTSHDIIRLVSQKLLHRGGNSADMQREIGFMFPGECANDVFSINLMCQEWLVYRPKRLSTFDQNHG